ncbi:MAG TPA: hypothetical protein VF421_12990 [Niabella sp.]
MKHLLILSLALLLFAAGCKKDRNEKTAQTSACRISRLVAPDGKEIKITYNADGSYQAIDNEQNDEVLTPIYSSGSVVITTVSESTGKVTRKTTVLLNSSGMAYGVKYEYYNSAGTITGTNNYVYEYNGTELAKSTASYFNGTTTTNTTETFGWTDGNLTSTVTNTGVSIYEYYTGKPAQLGDVLSISSVMLNGFDINLIIKNKNLLKSLSGTEVGYTFDTEGRINTISYNGELQFNIEYECN